MTATEAKAAGVRVVEFAGSGIPAAYAGWMLAEMGAEVLRLERPDGQDAPGEDALALALAALAGGKEKAELPRDEAAFATLLQDVDILLCDDPTALAEVAGSLAALRARVPRLVIGLHSIFGIDGPYAGQPGVGLDAQALSGVAWALGDPAREPLSLPPGILEHQGGAMLAAGSLMALNVRDATGAGRVVDIALADVLASYVAGNCRFYIHHGMEWRRSGQRASSSGGAYPYVILPCADGEVCICGRTREEWNRLVGVMGNPAWAADPRYQDLRAMGRKYPEEVDALIKPWLARHSMAELEQLALANNLIVSPVRGFDEVLATPRFHKDGFLRQSTIDGHDVSTPALPFRVLEERGATSPDVTATLLASAAPAPEARAGSSSAGPLAGMRVIDFGWVWSAPWVGTMLGELGAEVIKVEHSKRPDNLRLSGKVWRDGQVVEGPSTEMSPMYHQVNHGKLGITLNAKEPRAVELLKQLVADSDLVIENMSPGSLERSGLGYEALNAVNPRIVMLAMSAAGQFGALAGMRAYAPTMSSFAGLEALVGYPGEPPIGALNVGLGDPNASVHALVPVLAALRRARSTGKGCYIDLSQIEALSGTLRPYMIESQVVGRQTAPMGNRHPTMAPHGIYPAAGDDRWLTLAVADDRQWQGLVALCPDQMWATDARFRDSSQRLAHVAELDAAIAAWTATQSRDALVTQLRAAGIASSPVLSIEEMWADPHYAARKIKHPVDIPIYGREDVFRAPWRFSDFAPQIDRPGPRMGEHNARVFGDILGLPQHEIDALVEAGVMM